MATQSSARLWAVIGTLAQTPFTGSISRSATSWLSPMLQAVEQILAVAQAHAQRRGDNAAYAAPGRPAVAGAQHWL